MEPVRLRMGTDEKPGGGARRWTPKHDTWVPEPCRVPVSSMHSCQVSHAPSMLTTDLALRLTLPTKRSHGASLRDQAPVLRCLRRGEWFKLTHRYMGPLALLPRPARAEGSADGAVPRPPPRSPTDRPAGHRLPRPGLHPDCPSPNWSIPPGRFFTFTFRGSASAEARTAHASAWRRRRIGKS